MLVRWWFSAFIVLAYFSVSPSYAEPLYKCTPPKGPSVYQDAPCLTGRSERIEIQRIQSQANASSAAATSATTAAEIATISELYKSLSAHEKEVASAAIQSAAADADRAAKDADRIAWCVTAMGALLAVLAGVAGVFGLREGKEWRDLRQKFERETNEAILEANKVVQDVTQLLEEHKKNGEASLQRQNLLYDFIQARHLQTNYFGEKDLAVKRKQGTILTKVLGELLKKARVPSTEGRILSWALAASAEVYSFLGDLELALKLGEESVNCNPDHQPDREFNVACYAAKVYNRDRTNKEALNNLTHWLLAAIAVDSNAAQDALTDDDLLPVLDVPEVQEVLGMPKGKQSS